MSEHEGAPSSKSETADPELRARVRELEAELLERERDLSLFRGELAKANLQLERFIKQIAQELKLANLIQKALVPTEFPNIPGFEFSSKFAPSPLKGGDYFDIFEHEDKFRFGIVLATSSGYSMSSLFLSVLLKMTGQLEARKGGAPEKMLELMARELVPNIQAGDQASVFYGVIDRRSFEFHYSSAGRSTAFLFSYGTNKIQRLDADSEAIGPGFRGDLKSATVSLNPRDRLIVCSDGVSSAANARGEMFGEERLYKAILGAPRLGVHELRNEIFYQVEKFAQGCDLPQDMTVIVTEVKDRVIKLAKSPSKSGY
jgi:sigma-B regulation protein RsbU (phosphoserine phosphatase)